MGIPRGQTKEGQKYGGSGEDFSASHDPLQRSLAQGVETGITELTMQSGEAGSENLLELL